MLRRGLLRRQRGGPPRQLAPPLPPAPSQVAFEERAPRAPLLVLPNGASLPAEVRALKRVGFSGAIALHDALGVPTRAGGAAAAAATPASAAAPADASVQERMLGRRQALADTFVRNMRGDGAAAAAEDGEEDGEDEGFEPMPGGDAELGVARFCADHKLGWHINVRATRCAAADCQVQSSYGPASSRKPVVCSKHRRPGDVDVRRLRSGAACQSGKARCLGSWVSTLVQCDAGAHDGIVREAVSLNA